MACLREQTPDRRIGVVSCDEEGCVYRLVTLNHDPLFAEHTSEADCILQLRLRAGNAEESRKLKRGEIENLLNQKLTDWQWARISDLVWFRAGDAPGESLGVDEIARNLEASRLPPVPDPGMHRTGKYPWARTSENQEVIVSEKDLSDLLRRLGGGNIPGRRIFWEWFDERPQIRRESDDRPGDKPRDRWERAMGLPSESGGDEGERPLVDWDRVDYVMYYNNIDGHWESIDRSELVFVLNGAPQNRVEHSDHEDTESGGDEGERKFSWPNLIDEWKKKYNNTVEQRFREVCGRLGLTPEEFAEQYELVVEPVEFTVFDDFDPQGRLYKVTQQYRLQPRKFEGD